jgi:ribosome-binding ATPase YchF (GTP1/OBG family)
MSDEMDVERGRRAKDVLDNEVYSESYGLIEKELIRLWRESRDKSEREDLHKLLRMLEKSRNVLETVMRTGRLAQDALVQKQNLMQRVGARFRPD